MSNDKKYTNKILVPQYEPKNKVKPVLDLYDTSKFDELYNEIKKSNLTDEEKRFLKFAATRHIAFNYSDIADYYANSRKELQEFMEKSALVIIDIEDAIANGYVRLSSRIEEIIGERKNKDE